MPEWTAFNVRRKATNCADRLFKTETVDTKSVSPPVEARNWSIAEMGPYKEHTLCDQEKSGEPRRLDLVGYISVPKGGGNTVVQLEVEGRMSISVHQVKFWRVQWVSRSGVNMESTKIRTPFSIRINAGIDEVILVPEDHKSSASDLRFVRELTLHTDIFDLHVEQAGHAPGG